MTAGHFFLALAAAMVAIQFPGSFASRFNGQPAVVPLGLKDGDAPMDYDRSYYKIKQKYKKYRKYAPHELLRSEASDEGTPVLAFASEMGPDPTIKDLRKKKLKHILGSSFDYRFMSQEEPHEHILRPNGTLVYRFEKGKPAGRMPPEFRNLRFRIPERRKLIQIKSRRYRKKLQEFLWSYSYCPVLYKWRDLGPKIWPRWIKEGSCYSERSCSFPAGMSCQSKGRVRKKLLYWHCSLPNHCNWIVFEYPIVTECKCACPERNS